MAGADTTTPNYGWVQPAVGGDAAVWGTYINQDLAAIDNQVFQNEQGVPPVGVITMFGGAAAPANWLLCNGQSLAQASYQKLFNVIGTVFGSAGSGFFNLPNLGARFPIGVGTNAQGVGTGLGEATGSFSTPIATANLPAHAHPITDVAHNHGATQAAHAHAIATGGHAHTFTTNGHSHGGVLVSSGVTGGVPEGVGIVGNVGNTGVASDSGTTTTVGNLGGNTDTQAPGVSIQASGTNLSTTQPVGSGTPLSVVPPFLAVNFIIRFQ